MRRNEVELRGESLSLAAASPHLRIRGVDAQIAIGRNDHFLTVLGFLNKVRIKENFGRVELCGEDNELCIERDMTGWVTLLGRNNRLRVEQSLLEEGRPGVRAASDLCVVCYFEYHVADDNVERLGCAHYLHKSCLAEYRTRFAVCPICKAALQ